MGSLLSDTSVLIAAASFIVPWYNEGKKYLAMIKGGTLLTGLSPIEQAIVFAASAHHGQARKATETPYIVHPFSVAMILQQEGCSEAVVMAGLLHDTLEDTDRTYEDLVRSFGTHVADIVQGCSEPDKTKSWEARKQHTIESLKTASEEVCLVVCADKIHNLRSMNTEFGRLGDDLWRRFKRGREKQEWYYKAVADVLFERLGGHPLYDQFIQEVRQLFH